MHLLRNSLFTKCAFQREDGCSQFFTLLNMMKMRKLHVLICMQLHSVARSSCQEIHQRKRRKKNVIITNLERLFKQTSDKLCVVISVSDVLDTIQFLIPSLKTNVLNFNNFMNNCLFRRIIQMLKYNLS